MFALVASCCIIWYCCTVVVHSTDCPDLWMPFDGSCYRIGHQQLTFFEAEHYCQLHNGHLVHIETKTEDAFIQEEISVLQANRFWIGLTDDDIEGRWVWFGKDTTAEYTNWYPGQPSTAREDCGEIIRDSSGNTKWNDVDCHAQRLPICEQQGENRGNSIIG